MPKRPTRRRTSSILDVDINLTPVMNLVMVLIPFLLLTAVFAKTAVIDVYLPQLPSAASKKAASAEDALLVRLTQKGFQLGGIGRGLAPIEKKDGRYDFERLNEKVMELKKNHPSGEEAILLFEPHTPYELVIKTMDAVRESISKKDGKVTRTGLFKAISVGEAGQEG